MNWKRVQKFFFPDLNRRFAVRLVLVAVVAYVVFGTICIPTRINGRSMEPTYRDGSWNFCWRPRYRFGAPERGNLVIVRLAGTRVMFFKRVVALAGDDVEFRDGRLFVNGVAQDEPYVQGPCDWNLEKRTVETGNVYVVGDNRAVPMRMHKFGQTSLSRVAGGPLW